MANPVTPRGTDRAKLTPLDAAELRAAEARCEKATPGPWAEYRGSHTKLVAVLNPGGTDIVSWQGFDDSMRSVKEHRANAALIAHSRTDLPRALEGNRRWLALAALIEPTLRAAADVASYRDHRTRCEIGQTDVCTCGLRAAMKAIDEKVGQLRALLAEPSSSASIVDTNEVHHG